MANTPSFQFEPEKPINVTFPTKDPFWTGKNKWGKDSFGYNVLIEGMEYAVWASETMNRDIRENLLGGSMTMTITKTSKLNNAGKPMTYFEVLGHTKTTNTEAFTQELDNSINQEAKQNKDELITRTAIAKSLIEAGRFDLNEETKKFFDAWLHLVKTGEMKKEATDNEVLEEYGF
jgi:hypothetical protein